MKKACTSLLMLVLLSACVSNRYKIEGEGGEQWFLKEYIGLMMEQGSLGNKPLVVVDGIPYRCDYELKDASLKLHKKDIVSLRAIRDEEIIAPFDSLATDGILFITTKVAENLE